MARSAFDLVADIWFGIRGGMAVALAFSVMALIAYAIGGSKAFAGNGVTVFATLSAYVAGGVSIGAITGAARPFLGNPVGLFVIGAVDGVIAAVIFRVAQDGIHFWKPDDASLLEFFAGFGVVTAFYLRYYRLKRAKRGKNAADGTDK